MANSDIVINFNSSTYNTIFFKKREKKELLLVIIDGLQWCILEIEDDNDDLTFLFQATVSCNYLVSKTLGFL